MPFKLESRQSSPSQGFSKIQKLISDQIPIEPEDDDTLTIQQKALSVFKYRVNLYFKTIPKKDWIGFEGIIERISDRLLQISTYPLDLQDFKLASLCASTRILEQNTTHQNGQPCFPNFRNVNFKIVQAYLRQTLALLEMNTQFKQIANNSPLVLHAKRNLKKNKNILQQIFGQIEFNEKYLDEYFDKVQIYIVTFPQSIKVYGISHYRGMKLYLSQDLFTNLPIEQEQDLTRFDKPKKSTELSSYQLLLLTVEHESIHDIVRFVLNNRRLCYISPRHNSNLKYQGKEIEAGQFYAHEAYNIIPSIQGPFCLNRAH